MKVVLKVHAVMVPSDEERAHVERQGLDAFRAHLANEATAHIRKLLERELEKPKKLDISLELVTETFVVWEATAHYASVPIRHGLTKAEADALVAAAPEGVTRYTESEDDEWEGVLQQEVAEELDCSVLCGNDPEYKDACTRCGGTGMHNE